MPPPPFFFFLLLLLLLFLMLLLLLLLPGLGVALHQAQELFGRIALVQVSYILAKEALEAKNKQNTAYASPKHGHGPDRLEG